MNKLAWVVVLAACGEATEDRCARTVEKVMGTSSKQLAVRAEVSKAVTESCRTLVWSAAMHDCIDKADGSKAGLRTCDALLSPDQLAAVKEALTPKAVTREADRADKDATVAVAEAEAKLLKLEQDMKKSLVELQVIFTERAAAKTKADRDKIDAMTLDLEKLISALDEKIAGAKAELARAKRRKGVTISKECLENPLAKGCN